ncbi:hypothetical protein M378DRAFT_395030 [Amanita muscaria Koide BX008]|uniref:ATP synthase F0 subunit 8 n=1 Tax=Amanita muscaria (strain Koide BX008) TaxID=946122 RepID=A0A0C2W827_AMAMK|nr:hypothetical protein M378DRAFT_395030 [Amanita muscaria Koide BX008]
MDSSVKAMGWAAIFFTFSLFLLFPFHHVVQPLTFSLPFRFITLINSSMPLSKRLESWSRLSEILTISDPTDSPKG